MMGVRVLYYDENLKQIKNIFDQWLKEKTNICLWKVLEKDNNIEKVKVVSLKSYKLKYQHMELEFFEQNIGAVDSCLMVFYGRNPSFSFKCYGISTLKNAFILSIPFKSFVIEENISELKEDVKAIFSEFYKDLMDPKQKLEESHKEGEGGIYKKSRILNKLPIFEKEVVNNTWFKQNRELLYQGKTAEKQLNNNLRTKSSGVEKNEVEVLDDEFMKIIAEEIMFERFRLSKRTKGQGGEKLKVQLDSSDDIFEFEIYDMSRGGVSFTTDDEKLLRKGDMVKILEINNVPLFQVLSGVVKNINSISAEKEQRVKIGVQFIGKENR